MYNKRKQTEAKKLHVYNKWCFKFHWYIWQSAPKLKTKIEMARGRRWAKESETSVIIYQATESTSQINTFEHVSAVHLIRSAFDYVVFAALVHWKHSTCTVAVHIENLENMIIVMEHMKDSLGNVYRGGCARERRLIYEQWERDEQRTCKRQRDREMERVSGQNEWSAKCSGFNILWIINVW